MEFDKHRIMVVDDDEGILDLARTIIEMEGWEPVLVQDPNNLVEKIKKVKPDIVLLDIQLGGLDGRYLCKELKNIEEYAKTPIILFSANNNLGKEAKESQCDDFISKPFELKIFRETIIKYLRPKQQGTG